MKTIYAILVAVLTSASAIAGAQDWPDEYLGLPGDNLNLYAVMNLFQESETLEGFESKLNDEDSRINNLDLNGDYMVDYITVSDYVDGNVHTIVLRAILDRNEQQDVAVFIVEELRNGKVQIQLIGDEALYGKNYIIEPYYAETANPGYRGKPYRRNVNVVTTSYYDIAYWPVIRYMYRPGYVVWRSSWYWGYYPTYWYSWKPYYWHYYYGYHYNWHDHYYTHYRHWDRYRCRSYKTYYHSHVRVYSPAVKHKINKGYYTYTYSRPEQRRAGEELYARTYNSRNAQHKRSNASTRNAEGRSYATQSRNSGTNGKAVSARSTTNVNSRGRQVSGNAKKETTAYRTTSPSSRSRSSVSTERSSASQNGKAYNRNTTVQRSSNSRPNNATVQRSSNSRPNNATVQRSSNSRSNNASVQSRSSNVRSTPAVQRSGSKSHNSKTVQRSPQSSHSKSTVQRSPQSNKSKSTVQRSPQSSHNKSTVQRSPQSNKSKSTVQRSSSSAKQTSRPQDSNKKGNGNSSVNGRSARR